MRVGTVLMLPIFIPLLLMCAVGSVFEVVVQAPFMLFPNFEPVYFWRWLGGDIIMVLKE